MATGKKNPLHSKTLWVNILAIIALVVQYFLGLNLSAEAQVSALAAINVALRLITKDEIVWEKE